MSMGIQVYAVDEAEFKRLFGSNDIALLEKLLDPEGWGKSLQLRDEGMQDVVDGERPRLTLFDALRLDETQGPGHLEIRPLRIAVIDQSFCLPNSSTLELRLQPARGTPRHRELPDLTLASIRRVGSHLEQQKGLRIRSLYEGENGAVHPLLISALPFLSAAHGNNALQRQPEG